MKKLFNEKGNINGHKILYNRGKNLEPYRDNIPETDKREIDMCLSCTKKRCNGECIKIKRKEYLK